MKHKLFHWIFCFCNSPHLTSNVKCGKPFLRAWTSCYILEIMAAAGVGYRCILNSISSHIRYRIYIHPSNCYSDDCQCWLCNKNEGYLVEDDPINDKHHNNYNNKHQNNSYSSCIIINCNSFYYQNIIWK